MKRNWTKKHYLAIVALTVVMGQALADVGGEYVKKGSVADVKQQGKAVEFSINSSVGENACNLEGTAVMIDANRAAYTSDDATDKCVAMLNFTGGQLKVTTKGCDGYCGMNAAGSMDGAYKKSSEKRTDNAKRGNVAQ